MTIYDVLYVYSNRKSDGMQVPMKCVLIEPELPEVSTIERSNPNRPRQLDINSQGKRSAQQPAERPGQSMEENDAELLATVVEDFR